MNKRMLLAALPLALFACQEVEQPKTVLTQEQWKEVQQYILKDAPTPKYKVGANLGGKIEFIGFDVTEPLEAGKKATFTWYWKALDDIDESWKVFVHFDSTAKPYRQNLDHVPVNGMYDTARWKKGQIIKDVQEVTIQANFPPGKATPYIGFYKGKKRLPVSNDVPKTKEGQPRIIGPTLTVKGSDGASKAAPAVAKPKYGLRQVKADDVADVKIDGKVDEELWKRITPIHLKPFGNAEKLSTWVKMFVTPDALYVAAQMSDRHIWGTMKNRDDETWKQEVLELFLDVDGDGKDYLELQITPANTIFDANFPTRLGTGEGSREEQINKAKSWNMEGLESAVDVEGTLNDDSDQDQHWTVELKLPLDQIPGLSDGNVSTGDAWALNLYRFDRPKEGTTWAYAWSTAPRGDFHQVDKFGEVRITSPLDLKRPVITPQMLKEMRKNIDLKVRPSAKSLQLPPGVQPDQPEGTKAPPTAKPSE